MKDCVYRCNLCSKTFGRRRLNRDKHIQKAHQKKVTCDRCRREFDGNHSYQTHSKDCFYRCDRCEFVNKYEARMEVHKRTHITEDRKGKEYAESTIIVYK